MIYVIICVATKLQIISIITNEDLHIANQAASSQP